MDEKYKEVLKELNLNDNEVEIFISLLKLGESSVQKVSNFAGISRTTAYHILETLLKKGFVSFVIKEKIKFFQAISPKLLVKDLEDKKKRINEIVPYLDSLSKNLIKKPSIKVYEGLKGIKTILDDVLETKKEILHYGDILSLNDILKHRFPIFIKRRVEKKIPIRVIGKKEFYHDELIKNSKKELREFVFIPKDYSFSSSFFIYDKKVSILNLKKEPYYGIIVEDENFYLSQKIVFELLWKVYKRMPADD